MQDSLQKGSPTKDGVDVNVHPDSKKIQSLIMYGMTLFHAHNLWLNAEAT